MGQLKNFVTKLTPKQLVDFMIKSIEEPVVALNFDTFGRAELLNVTSRKIACFGCAATNFALKAANKDSKDVTDYIKTRTSVSFDEYDRCIILDEDWFTFLSRFEVAIDCLRKGKLLKFLPIRGIDGYNVYAAEIGLPFLPLHKLPTLGNYNWHDNIGEYKKYSESLITTKYYRHKSDEHAELFELIVNSKTWYNQYDEKIEPSHILAKKSARTIVLKPDGSYFIQGAAGYFYYTEKPNYNV